jgi:arylsulfatase A-like enzyme
MFSDCSSWLRIRGRCALVAVGMAAAGVAGCGAEVPDGGRPADAGAGIASAAVSRDAEAGQGGEAGAAGLVPRAPGAPLAKNVILISLDTVRADRLEPYGYARPTSPNLAALASRAVLFEQAQAQAPQTAPSHASLFTSEYPGTHGIYNVHGDHKSFPTLPEGLRTLAELVQAAGVETAAFVCGGNLTRKMEMDRGFEMWDEKNEDVSLRVDALLHWLKQPRSRPFLALLHTYQAHAPYLPPEALVPQFTDAAYAGPLRERLARYLKLPPDQAWSGGVGPDYWLGMLEYTDADVRFLSDLYDAEIAYVDAELRRVLEAVLLGPLAKDTAIIVLADHGEEFRDHGKFQHDQTFEELVHVPLLVRLPADLEGKGWKGRVPTSVELIDVAPTVAELLGLGWEGHGWEGRSLLPLLDPSRRRDAGFKARPRYSELTVAPGPKVYGCITANGWKYTHIHQQDIDKTWESLFELQTDPGEKLNRMHDTEGDVPRILASLKGMLEDRRRRNQGELSAAGSAGIADMDEESRLRLQALGYLNGQPGSAQSPPPVSTEPHPTDSSPPPPPVDEPR